MKELKRIICGIMAVLMLADAAVGVSCTAYAEESAPEEQEAILHMESVKGESVVSPPASIATDFHADNIARDEQCTILQAAHTEDVNCDEEAPEIDLTSIQIDAKEHILQDYALLQVRITDQSDIRYVYCSYTAGNLDQEIGAAMNYNPDTGYYECAISCDYTDEWALIMLEAADVSGNTICYYDEKYFPSEWYAPKADLSAGTFSVVNRSADQVAPVVTESSFSVSDKNPLAGSWVSYQIEVIDDSPISRVSIFIPPYGVFGAVAGGELTFNAETGNYEFKERVDRYGVYEIQQISIWDACGNKSTYYNSAASTYSGQQPAVDMSGATITTADSNPNDHTPPSIDVATLYTSYDKSSQYPKLSFEITDDSTLGWIEVGYSFDSTPNVLHTCNNKSGGRLTACNERTQIFEADIWGGSLGDRFKIEYISISDANGNHASYYDKSCYTSSVPEDAIIVDFRPASFIIGRIGMVSKEACSIIELIDVLEDAKEGTDVYLKNAGDFAINKNLTIPKGVYLNIQSGTNSFQIEEGVVFSTISDFDCRVPMIVAGTWVNKSNSTCHNGLTITSSGTLENSGTIEVYGDYIPNGTIIESAGHHIRVNYTVSTMEELLAAIDKVKTADSITIESSDEAFVIDQSVTIPNGVRLSAERAITIGKGVTFTTIGGFDCYAPLTVDGTWKCSGHSYCYGGLSITSTGCVENSSYLYIYDSYDNQGTLIADFNWSTRLILRVSGKQTLKEDMTLSENLSLYIYGQTSDAALTVSEGVSLTTMGEFYCYIPLTVAGTWVNEGGSTCNSGLTITPTGTVDNARGWIHLNGALNNEGALTNSSGVYQTNTASSPEELTLAIEHTLTGGTIRVSGDGGDFVINKEMTIPAGITVEVYGDVQNLRIGTNLTIDAGATLRSEAPLVVEGTIYNYGAIGAKNGLHVPGKIHNYDYIRVNGELTGEENIVEYEAGFCSVYQEYSIDSEESLLAVLDSMDMKKWNKIVAADSLTLTKDTTIPAGVYLEIQSGTFRISENATLVTYNNLDIHEDMVVDGYWENRYTNYGGYCGIRGNLTAKNVIKNSGHIELYKYCQALAEGMIDSSEGSQGSVGCGITITSLDELRSITEKENCPRMSIIWNPAEPVVLDRDLTIPDGLRLYIEGESTFIIPTDVTLSIGEADVHLDAIDIAGALVNNGNVAAGTIIVSGLLENTGAISFTELIGCETAHIKNGGILAGEIDDQCMIESIARAGGAKNFRLRLDRNYAWEDIFANVQSGDSVYFDSLYDDCWLIVSGDTIIPDDVQISGLCTVHVLEGATLTTNGTAFSPYMMLIDGAWINNGSVDLDILTVNGTVRNNGQITVWEITGDKNVVGNAVVNQSSNSGQYVTILDLQEALDSAEPGETIRCYQLAYGNGDSTILNTDIVVPEGITLEFSSVSKVYLTAGHTLTVNGTLLMQQQLYVAGNLVVNGNVTVDAADGEGSYFLNMFDLSLGGIAVTDTGSCSVNGSIRVAKIDYSGQLISDPLSVLNGVDGSAFSARETDRYWYLANSSESAILCTVQNDDCTLRLLNETGCVWQAFAVSDGVLITGVAPGQYTLEVSKPGYVTRCYAVDTGNMMDGPSVQLVRRGNINGACVGGIDVEITDLACLYQYLTEGKNEGSIQDETYFKAVADVNDNGNIDVYDLQGLYEAVSGVRGF